MKVKVLVFGMVWAVLIIGVVLLAGCQAAYTPPVTVPQNPGLIIPSPAATQPAQIDPVQTGLQLITIIDPKTGTKITQYVPVVSGVIAGGQQVVGGIQAKDIAQIVNGVIATYEASRPILPEKAQTTGDMAVAITSILTTLGIAIIGKMALGKQSDNHAEVVKGMTASLDTSIPAPGIISAQTSVLPKP